MTGVARGGSARSRSLRRALVLLAVAAFLLAATQVALFAAEPMGRHLRDVALILDSGERFMRLEVRDDGVGGAAREGGSGSRGIADRVDAIGGGLAIHSAPGHGTALLAEIPCES